MTDETFDGTIDIQNEPVPNGKTTIKLIGGKVGAVGIDSGGAAYIGGNGNDGTITFFPKTEIDPFEAIKLLIKRIDEISTIRLLGGTSSILLDEYFQPQLSFKEGLCQLSPEGMKLFKKFHNQHKNNQASIYLDGKKGNLWIGGNGTSGSLAMFPENKPNSSYPLLFESDSNKVDPSAYTTIYLNAKSAMMELGRNGSSGSIRLYPAKGFLQDDIRLPWPTIEFHADYGLWARAMFGGYDKQGLVEIYPKEGSGYGSDKPSIVLDGEKGDINLLNADCAEEFDLSDSERDTEVKPGTLMVIDNKGKLRKSYTSYDTRVAGVVSGAGNCKPGIILDTKRNSPDNRLPLALVGKVNCNVDASYSKIQVGDMLTTSNTPGHAMKVMDKSKAFGAVIGKALHHIESGKGLIPILVALQ